MGVREKKYSGFDRMYCESLIKKRPEFMLSLEECLEMLNAADRAAEELFRSLDKDKEKSSK